MLLTKPIKVKTLFKQKHHNSQSFLIKMLRLEKLVCWGENGNLDCYDLKMKKCSSSSSSLYNVGKELFLYF